MLDRNTISYDKVKELFNYNNGNLIRKVKTAICCNVGDIVGNQRKDGYTQVKIDGKLYLTHRLIFLYHHGYLPENEIDHINRIKNDNRIENLREVSQSCNRRNCGNPKNNTSNIKGIYLNTKNNKWRAQIKINNIVKNLGNFDNKEDAVLARLAAEQCLNWSKCDDNSPAYQYAIEKGLIKKQVCHDVL